MLLEGISVPLPLYNYSVCCVVFNVIAMCYDKCNCAH